MSNPPVNVTLSGNSTPLLPGCGDCAEYRRFAEHARDEVLALRARLASAQADAARWEGAAKTLYTALKDFADGECHCDESERECVQCCATKAITTASALVREGGGGE